MINLYTPLKNTSEKDKTQGGETLKLRNINRGLVLGGVLALGVVCYTAYDNNQFKTSKPEIEQTMRDYIADLTSANVGSSDKLKSQLTDFVDKHYADYTTSDNEYASSKSGLLDEINQAEVATQGGDITSAEYDIKEMSINKSGADGAKVTMIYNVCYDVSKGDPTLTEIFLELDVDMLSVVPSRVLPLRKAVRSISLKDPKKAENDLKLFL